MANQYVATTYRLLALVSCRAIWQHVEASINEPGPRIPWVPMSEGTSATLLPSIQPLIQGAVASLGSEHHLSLVFLGCGLVMQEGLAPSLGDHRVSFLREVFPTISMGKAQRELVISCGGEPTNDRQNVVDLRTLGDSCGHPFCSTTMHGVGNINWMRRSLILVRPISERIMRNARGESYFTNPFIQTRIFNRFLDMSSSVLWDRCPFLQEYTSVYFIVYGQSQSHYTAALQSTKETIERPQIHRMWLIRSGQKHGLPGFSNHKDNLIETCIDLRKPQNREKYQAARMFDVPLRNSTELIDFTSTGIRLSQSNNADLVVELHDCDDIKVS